MRSKITVFPNRIDTQDSSQSITTADGTYDFENFSENEASTILDVLKTVKEKYPPMYRAIGLVNESSQILYKPRYVLFQIVVQLYKNSSTTFDNLAVALAYETKGASFRKSALEHFEIVKNEICDSILNRFFVLLPYSFFLKISYLYEKEHRYEEALELTEKAVPYSDFEFNPLTSRIAMLNEKIKNPPKKRNRKVSEREIVLEEKIENAATYFIRESNFK